MIRAPALDVDVVVPTIGRSSLDALLASLAGQGVPANRIRVVYDAGHRGPAATRNEGWRASTAEWVAFLDDDVVPDGDWWTALREDIAACGPDVAATQGRLTVPLPDDRPPTDWERNVAALEAAQWATADMAYRRSVLSEVGGFDERFPRAYREDADLGLRVTAAGYRIERGSRHVTHPVRPAPWHVSLAKQAGNADDALMQRLHGRDWRARAGAPAGARPHHLAVTAFAATAAVSVALEPRLAAVAAIAWVAATARFAWRRIAPGPRDAREVAAMFATSAVLPINATAWWLLGILRTRKERAIRVA